MGVFNSQWVVVQSKTRRRQGEAFQRYKAFAGDESNVGQQQQSSKT